MSVKIEIKPFRDSFGVFAHSPICKDEPVIAIREGITIHHPTQFSVQTGIDKHIEIPSDDIAVHTDFFWRYLNHSCSPNTKFISEEKIFKATRDINPGEQVMFNYLTTEYDMAHPFDCFCGSTNCMGHIRGFRYLTRDQKEALLLEVANHIKLLHFKEIISIP